MTVELPLSAGRMMIFGFRFNSLRAILSDLRILEGGGLALRSIEEMSCLVSSASLSGRCVMALSTWQIMFSVGMCVGVMEKLKPLARALMAMSVIGVSE